MHNKKKFSTIIRIIILSFKRLTWVNFYKKKYTNWINNLLPIILLRHNVVTHIMRIMKSRMSAIINSRGKFSVIAGNPQCWTEGGKISTTSTKWNADNTAGSSRPGCNFCAGIYTKPVGICHRGTVKFNPFTSYARESHPRDFGSSS